MRYQYGDLGEGGEGCRVWGHTWPHLQHFDRVCGRMVTRRIPWWRRRLNIPYTCHRCGAKRYPR